MRKELTFLFYIFLVPEAFGMVKSSKNLNQFGEYTTLANMEVIIVDRCTQPLTNEG